MLESLQKLFPMLYSLSTGMKLFLFLLWLLAGYYLLWGWGRSAVGQRYLKAQSEAAVAPSASGVQIGPLTGQNVVGNVSGGSVTQIAEPPEAARFREDMTAHLNAFETKFKDQLLRDFPNGYVFFDLDKEKIVFPSDPALSIKNLPDLEIDWMKASIRVQGDRAVVTTPSLKIKSRRTYIGSSELGLNLNASIGEYTLTVIVPYILKCRLYHVASPNRPIAACGIIVMTPEERKKADAIVPP